MIHAADSVAPCVSSVTCALNRFSDDAVSAEAAEHQFELIQAKQDLSEAWFEIK